jgi:hypothetical protein
MSDTKEKITATLENKGIETLYELLRDYFFENTLDPQEEEKFRTLEPLYDEIKAAMRHIYPEYFKFHDDDYAEPVREVVAGGDQDVV